MSVNFPTSLDSLVNPTATDNTAVVHHATQHANANDAIEALEAKVGVDSSAVTTSLDYKLKSTSSIDPGHKHSISTLTDLPTPTPYASPTGSVNAYAGSSAPNGWLLCDGSSLLRASYTALFAIIGTTYGSADGTHFTLPNLKGKVVVGYNASETEFDVLGETGGEKTHTLLTAEMPAHSHNAVTDSGSTTGLTLSSAGGATYGQRATNSIGSGTAHNNLQPYITLNYIIKT